MLARAMMVGVAILGGAVPATSQQRGTVELGAFASNTTFDNELGMNNSWGAGGRIGVFLVPRLSVEFEGGGSNAGRTLGLQDVNVGILSARLTAVPLKFGRVSVLLGGGGDHTDTYFVESYGVHGLLGAKFAFSETAVLRIDGIGRYMAAGKYTNMGLHMGLSVYRNPVGRTAAGRPAAAAAPAMQRPDSVSAYETQHLRAVAVSYRALRDSLARPRDPIYVPTSHTNAVATMTQRIYFQNDRSSLSDSAKVILRDKVRIFHADSAIRIIIVGFASESGTAAYNLALGLRRAEAAKTYLVSRGIDPIRIEIATRGAGELMVGGSGKTADAANRRGQFRLLIADPYLAAPKK